MQLILGETSIIGIIVCVVSWLITIISFLVYDITTVKEIERMSLVIMLGSMFLACSLMVVGYVGVFQLFVAF